MNCWLLGPLLAVLAGLLGSTAAGQEFRIESEIFAGKETKPAARNLTLFANGVVYDFLLTAPEEVTVFDAERARFLLLDTSRRVKTEVTVDQVDRFVTALQDRAVKSGELLAEMARPKFTPEFDEASRALTLTGEKLSYRATCEPIENPAAAKAYALFVDRYTRLNATRPGSLPPNARLELNDALAARQLMPREVERTFGKASRWWGKQDVVRSEHLVNYRLLPTDRERIESVGDMVADFRVVDFIEFRGLQDLGK